MADVPSFSIVVAAYNAARTLPSTIRSVLEQSRSDFEIFVIDDGSTDGTDRALCSVWDDRIVYLRQQNLGPAAARNAGIERASGEFISLLDSDDLWLPNYLETMATTFDRMPDAGLAFTDAWRLDDVSRRIHRRTIMAQQRAPRRPPAEPEHLLNALLERNFVYTSATVRRKLMQEAGGFKTLTRSEDYELWLRLAARGTRFVNVGVVLGVYRDRPGSRIHDPVALALGQTEIYQHVISTYELTPTSRAVAERRLQATSSLLERLRARPDVGSSTSTSGWLRRRARDLRVFRLRPPRAVARAFPDLTAI